MHMVYINEKSLFRISKLCVWFCKKRLKLYLFAVIVKCKWINYCLDLQLFFCTFKLYRKVIQELFLNAHKIKCTHHERHDDGKQTNQRAEKHRHARQHAVVVGRFIVPAAGFLQEQKITVILLLLLIIIIMIIITTTKITIATTITATIIIVMIIMVMTVVMIVIKIIITITIINFIK